MSSANHGRVVGTVVLIFVSAVSPFVRLVAATPSFLVRVNLAEVVFAVVREDDAESDSKLFLSAFQLLPALEEEFVEALFMLYWPLCISNKPFIEVDRVRSLDDSSPHL
jgi:hypothetical protein